MDNFRKTEMKGAGIIATVIIITFFMLAFGKANAQRYRHGMYTVSYEQTEQTKFKVTPIKNDGELVKLQVTSTEEVMLFSYVIDLVIVFKDGSTLSLRNNPPESGQYIFTTFFDVNNKHRKQLLKKEINWWELRFREGRMIKQSCLIPTMLM